LYGKLLESWLAGDLEAGEGRHYSKLPRGLFSLTVLQTSLAEIDERFQREYCDSCPHGYLPGKDIAFVVLHESL